MFDWAVEAVADYVENVRPCLGCPQHSAMRVTERGGRLRPPEINTRFEAYREALRRLGEQSGFSLVEEDRLSSILLIRGNPYPSA
jgi:hypothetical protein